MIDVNFMRDSQLLSTYLTFTKAPALPFKACMTGFNQIALQLYTKKQ